MASVSKVETGDGPRWEVRWREGGRNRAKRCRTAAAANIIKRRIEHGEDIGEPYDPDRRIAQSIPAPDLVEDVFDGYLAERRTSTRPNTYRNDEASLACFTYWLQDREGRKAGFPSTLLTRTLLTAFYADQQASGLHVSTCNARVQAVQRCWAWAADCDEFEDFILRPRKILLAPPPDLLVPAPTWEEMDACVLASSSWYRQALVLLRYTGLRRQQVMGLRWEDIDMEDASLHVRGELGKSRNERRGRRIPISHHLVEELAGWGLREGWVVETHQAPGPYYRQLRHQRIRQFWELTPARPQAYRQPTHCFRKGMTSGLKALGADTEAVEHLLGHKPAGSRSPYMDPNHLPLRQAVGLIPRISTAASIRSRSALVRG